MANNKRRSCDVCYKRKIRCDATETGSTCDWCAHHNLTCTFTPRKPRSRTALGNTPKTRASPRISIAGSGQDSVLQSPPNTSAGSTPYSTGTSSGHIDIGRNLISSNKCTVCQSRTSLRLPRFSGKSSNRLQDAYPGHNYGFVCFLTSIPHFSDGCDEWVRMRTGLTPQFDTPTFQECLLDGESPLSASKTVLPPRWAFDEMFDAFIKSDLSLIFPLVDEVLFEETAQLAYSTDSPVTIQHVSAKACVFAFLSVVGMNFAEVPATKYVDSAAFSKVARRLISECLEDTGLSTLQTYLLMMMYDMAAGRMQTATTYNSLACLAVYALNGHQRLFPSPKNRHLTVEEREDRHVRLLFWMCYYFDKSISLRTGHPPAIDDDFCDLTLPEGYNESRWGIRSCDPNDDTQDVFFPGDMELTIVKSRVIRSLYGNRAWERSDAELLRTIRELDAELENWRSSIPREYAPALSVRKDITLANDMNRCMSMLHVELHLEYHHILNVIHGASGLSRAVNTTSGSLLPGIQSSIDLSVEASRSTLVYLTASADRVASEAFWAFIFYPMSALMTLFFSILRNPCSDHIMYDMDLISTAATIVRGMPIHTAVPFATEYLRQVDRFVEELHRLAKGGIERARCVKGI